MSTRTKLPRITEAEFMAQVLQLAKLRGWRTAHFRPAQTATGWRTAVQGDGKGFPDLVLIRRSEIVVAELKRSERDKTTDEQRAWLAAFRESGIRTFLWTPADWPEIEKVLA